MIYPDLQGGRLVLVIACACPHNPPQSQRIEIKVRGDEISELVDYAHDVTVDLVIEHHPVIFEYSIWDGLPSPDKNPILKWAY